MSHGSSKTVDAVRSKADHHQRSIGMKLSIALAAGLIVAFMISATRAVENPLFLTSWASSAALLLSAPEARACRSISVGASHGVAAVIGLVSCQLLPNVSLSIGLAVGLSIAIVLVADVLHPPAMVNAALAWTSSASPMTFLSTAAIGGLMLAMVPIVRTWLIAHEKRTKF
jgi:CBS-domain-containing membrane protein